MLASIFHEGSGLGDQLFRYITVRTLAEEKGLDWGMIGPKTFKGSAFMNLDMGLSFDSKKMSEYNLWNEKDVRDANGLDIRSYDPEIQFQGANTIIDGSFEDSKYWHHNLENINKWLTVEPLEVPDDLCVIGFRGGEYALNPDLFLGQDYYEKAKKEIEISTPIYLKYQIHTDDPKLARELFSNLFLKPDVIDNTPISHSKHTNMALNWRSARYAKYAIIPNSAFFIIPRLLKHLEDPTAVTIAPRGWARRNTKTWARPACYYKELCYI